MSDQWKIGNEFAPFHPDASHVEPGYRDGWNACYKMAADEIERLLAERDALKADAERYRWLREQPNDTTAPRIDVVRWIPAGSVNDGEGLRLDELDAAIDAHVEAQEAPQEK